MKATSFVLPIAGILLAGAVAFAGSGPVKTRQTKSAVAGQAAKAGADQAGKESATTSGKTGETKAMTQKSDRSTGKVTGIAAKSTPKTAASRRMHHARHHAKKSDTKQSPQK